MPNLSGLLPREMPRPNRYFVKQKTAESKRQEDQYETEKYRDKGSRLISGAAGSKNEREKIGKQRGMLKERFMQVFRRIEVKPLEYTDKIAAIII